MRRVLGGLVVCALTFAISAGTTQAQLARSMTIRLLSTAGKLSVLRDRPPRGAPSRGDILAVPSVLRNRVPQFGEPKGTVVGGDYSVFTFTSSHAGTLKVRVTLPGGTLRVSGRRWKGQKGPITDSVVAGTGSFLGARGTVYVRDLDRNGTHSINVYHLRLP
jgi:hypothetical protein